MICSIHRAGSNSIRTFLNVVFNVVKVENSIDNSGKYFQILFFPDTLKFKEKISCPNC